MSRPVALQLYSVREDASADFRATLEKVKEMGYDGVEFAGLFGNSAEEVKKMCESIGLVPVSAHVPLSDMLKDPNEVFSQYKTVGCKYIAIPYLPGEDRKDALSLYKFIGSAKVLGTIAKTYGLQLLYHNHEFEFEKINGEFIIDKLYKEIPMDLLQPQFDTCWINYAGENPAEFLKKYSGRIEVVHLKDFICQNKVDGPVYELIGNNKKTREENGFKFKALGQGVQDFKEILDACEKVDAEYLIVEQDQWYDDDPIECARMSREYLKNTFGI